MTDGRTSAGTDGHINNIPPSLFSSSEPKAQDKLLRSLSVRRPSVRASICPHLRTTSPLQPLDQTSSTLCGALC